MSKPFGIYDYIPRPRKVKHVKMFEADTIADLETAINTFADENPNFKILGVRVAFNPVALQKILFATVTYLEDAKTGFTGEEDYYGADEERDSD